MAKDKVGKLWEDVKKPPYTDLFNARVKAQQIWRMIRISRALEHKLVQLSSSCTERKKSTLIHGKRFILYMVFVYVGKERLFLNELDFETYFSNELPNTIENIIYNTNKIIGDKYKNNLVYQVFRNLDNYENLKKEIEKNI